MERSSQSRRSRKLQSSPYANISKETVSAKINISFRPALECYVTSNAVPLATVPMLQNVSLFLDYIFLDAPERRMFSQMNHEY